MRLFRRRPRVVMFRSSPSIILGVEHAQHQGVVVDHVVAVQAFVQDTGRSVIVLDCQSPVSGPLTVVVDGSPAWVIERLGLPMADATDAPAPHEQMAQRIQLPPRNGRSSARTMDKLPT